MLFSRNYHKPATSYMSSICIEVPEELAPWSGVECYVVLPARRDFIQSLVFDNYRYYFEPIDDSEKTVSAKRQELKLFYDRRAARKNSYKTIVFL